MSSDGGLGAVMTANSSASAAVTSISLKAVRATASGESESPTGAPTILTDEISLASTVNMLSVSGDFTSSGHGLLTGYLDGNQVFQLYEPDVPSEAWTFADIYLGNEYAPGSHTLMFRLDAYDNLDSSVDISDVQFGDAAVAEVPEPHTGMAWVLAMLVLNVRPRRSMARQTACAMRVFS